VIASVGAGAPNYPGRIVRGNNRYESGMVVADNLNRQKAALLLTLALTRTSDPTIFSACSTSIYSFSVISEILAPKAPVRTSWDT
jgi:L-asparaginase/Glu-tRNA(Gln) amidotransferase subunit D